MDQSICNGERFLGTITYQAFPDDEGALKSTFPDGQMVSKFAVPLTSNGRALASVGDSDRSEEALEPLEAVEDVRSVAALSIFFEISNNTCL
jgi:hypothetical protein